jgi:hypothetical protein
MPPRPTVAEYDAFARQWLAEVVLPRRHRTTKAGDRRRPERGAAVLGAVPNHLIQRFTGDGDAQPVLHVIAPAQRQLGEHVDARPLTEY